MPTSAATSSKRGTTTSASPTSTTSGSPAASPSTDAVNVKRPEVPYHCAGVTTTSSVASPPAPTKICVE